MNKIQTACIYFNLIILVATVIALPVGKVMRTRHLNPGSYVFGHIDNLTNWPTGFAFVLAWLSPIWAIGFFDSCVHMSEEAMHAARAVPLGIIWSAGAACLLGFLVMSIIAASMDQNVSHTLNTVFGQPMAQIYYDALGKQGALGFMAVLIFIQFLIGLSLVRPLLLQEYTHQQPDRRRFATSLGLLPRRRPPILLVLPTHLNTHPLPTRARHLRSHRRRPYLRPSLPHRPSRSLRPFLPLRSEQLRRMGHADSLLSHLGQGQVSSGGVLHRKI